MKFIVEVGFPLEPFSTYVRQGTAGEKIGEVLGAIKPEVIYFTDSGVGRGAMMIIEVDSASQVPHVTEPLMLNFDASVHYRVAVAPGWPAGEGPPRGGRGGRPGGVPPVPAGVGNLAYRQVTLRGLQGARRGF